MTKNKKQHYVPQFYLKQFSINHNKTSIYTFDKKQKKVFSSAIANIGQGQFFNESEGYSLENYFSDIEYTISDSINKELDNLRENNIIKDSILFKKSINIFIVTQFFRTHKIRKQFDSWYDTNIFNFYVNYVNYLLNNINELNKFLKIPILGIRFEKDTKRRFFNYLIIEFYPKILHAPKDKSKLVQIKRIIEDNKTLLKYRKMELLINKTEIPFVTSDEPVIITKNGKLFEHGLLNEETDIFLPLTPKFMIHLYDIEETVNTITKSYSLEEDYVLFYLDIKDFKYENDGFIKEPLEFKEINDRGVIIILNDYQFDNSVINVFSNDKELLEKYL